MGIARSLVMASVVATVTPAIPFASRAAILTVAVTTDAIPDAAAMVVAVMVAIVKVVTRLLTATESFRPDVVQAAEMVVTVATVNAVTDETDVAACEDVTGAVSVMAQQSLLMRSIQARVMVAEMSITAMP